jgi:hypothetical protein
MSRPGEIEPPDDWFEKAMDAIGWLRETHLDGGWDSYCPDCRKLYERLRRLL